MQQGRCVELSSEVALTAARKSLSYKIPMADSIIITTADSFGATLWTQDGHFEQFPGVKYKAKVAASG
jgi:predicted nucleic acid-binding protein